MLSVVFSSVGEMELEWRESKLGSKIIWEGRKGSKKVVDKLMVEPWQLYSWTDRPRTARVT